MEPRDRSRWWLIGLPALLLACSCSTRERADSTNPDSDASLELADALDYWTEIPAPSTSFGPDVIVANYNDDSVPDVVLSWPTNRSRPSMTAGKLAMSLHSLAPLPCLPFQ